MLTTPLVEGVAPKETEVAIAKVLPPVIPRVTVPEELAAAIVRFLTSALVVSKNCNRVPSGLLIDAVLA
jgi:hypothetical protein